LEEFQILLSYIKATYMDVYNVNKLKPTSQAGLVLKICNKSFHFVSPSVSYTNHQAVYYNIYES